MIKHIAVVDPGEINRGLSVALLVHQRHMEENQIAPSTVSTETVPEATTEAATVEQTTTQAETITNSATQEPDKETQEQQPVIERKPRAERRIDQLTAKLANQNPQGYEAYQQMFPNEPLIKPEEYEAGITPDVLEQRVSQRLFNAKNQWLQEAEARLTMRDTLTKHESDIRTIAEKVKDDPDMEARLTELYNKENSVFNPITGSYEFVPKVTMSELYQREVEFINNRLAKTQLQEAETLRKQEAEATVPTSGKSESSQSDDLVHAYEEARTTGDWKTYLKKKLF